MREDILLRAETAARYILAHGATVRDCAKHMGISKTTIHKDIRARLARENPGLAREAGEVLDKNRAERHLRGGKATREKYFMRGGGGT